MDKNTKIILFVAVAAMVLLTAFTNPQWFSSNKGLKIFQELEIKPGLFVGRRDGDQKANIYTKETKGWLFSDTARLLKLNDWYDIEFYDAKDDYLLFKNVLTGNKDLEVRSSSFEFINNEMLSKAIQDGNVKVEEEEIKRKEEEATHFDILTASDSKLWDFIQGDWHGSDAFSVDATIYYKLSVNGRHVTLKRYQYQEGFTKEKYSNVNLAPFETVLDCDIENLERRESVPIHYSDGLITYEDHARFNLPTSYTSPLDFVLKRMRSMYVDKPENNEVDFVGLTGGDLVYFTKGINFKF